MPEKPYQGLTVKSFFFLPTFSERFTSSLVKKKKKREGEEELKQNLTK